MKDMLANLPKWATGVVAALVFLGIFLVLNHDFLGGELHDGGGAVGAVILGLIAYRSSRNYPAAARQKSAS